MVNYNFAVSVKRPDPKKKVDTKKDTRKYNTKNNRRKLAEKAVDQMDLKDLTMMMEDQLDIFYEDLSTEEFNEEWNRVF